MNFNQYIDVIKCRVEGHEQIGVFGFCLNQQCKKKVCFKCLITIHNQHVQDCLHFDYFQDIMQNQILLLERICSLQMPEKKQQEEFKSIWKFIKQKIKLIEEAERLISLQEFSDSKVLSEMLFCHNSASYLKQFILGTIAIQNRKYLLDQLEYIYKTHDQEVIILELTEKGDVLREQFFYQEAIQCYEKATTLNQKDIISFLHKGLCFHMLDKIELAFECFNYVLKIEPQNTMAKKMIHQLNDSQRLASVVDIISFDPLNTQEQALKVQILSLISQYPQQALEVCQDQYQVYKNNYRVLTFMSQVLMNLFKFEQSLQFVEEALKIYPYYNRAQLIKVRCLTQLNQFDEAQKTLNKYKSKFNEKDVRYIQGQLLVNQGNYSQAAQQLSQDQDPNNRYQNLLQQGRLLLTNRQPNEALPFFIEAERIQPDTILLQESKGCCLLSLRRYDQAIACFEKVINLKFTHQKAWLYKGQALFFSGKLGEAIEVCETFLADNPQDNDVLNLKTQILLAQGRLNQNMGHIDMNLNSKDADTLITRAGVLVRQKQYGEALQVYHQVSGLLLNNIDIQIAKVFCLINMKDYKNALQIIDDFILKNNPNEFQALQQKGVALYHQKKYEAALSAFNNVKKFDPTYIEIDLYMGFKLQFKEGHCLFKMGKLSQAKEIYFRELQNPSWTTSRKTLYLYCYVKCLFYMEGAKEALRYYLHEGFQYYDSENLHIMMFLYPTYMLRQLKEFSLAIIQIDSMIISLRDETYANISYFLKGEILYQLNDYQQALECFESVKNCFLWIFEVAKGEKIVILGNCLKKMNRMDQAQQCFNKASSIFGKAWTSQQYEDALLEEIENQEETLKCWPKHRISADKFKILGSLLPI